MEGYGKLSFANGSNYHGQFSQDAINGKGVITLVDQRKYDGQWKNG